MILASPTTSPSKSRKSAPRSSLSRTSSSRRSRSSRSPSSILPSSWSCTRATLRSRPRPRTLPPRTLSPLASELTLQIVDQVLWTHGAETGRIDAPSWKANDPYGYQLVSDEHLTLPLTVCLSHQRLKLTPFFYLPFSSFSLTKRKYTCSSSLILP